MRLFAASPGYNLQHYEARDDHNDPMLPDELLSDELLSPINDRYPCRVPQLRRLSALIGDDDDPSPASIVVHGLEATGKTLILKSFLESSGSSFSWIPCHECVTARQLTQRIAATVSESLGAEEGVTSSAKCENSSVLAVQLQQVLKESQRKHILVLDRIDRQREAPLTLLASLGRLGEMIPNLTVIFVISVPKSHFLSSAEVPHVHFTPYSKEESIKILSKHVRRITKIPSEGDKEEEEEEEEYTEDDAKEELYVWEKLCGVVWDTLAKGVARNIVQFREIVDKMWVEFVQPIAEGKYGTRNFSQLYVFQKDMFKPETNVIDSVLPPTAAGRTTALKNMHDLPYYSKFLLCAAYLASYNPSRQDSLFFMKSGDSTKKRRRGGGRGRPSKNRKIPQRLLGPQAWPLERMLAIFYAILPHPIPSTVDIQTQVATLTSLRLLSKASATDVLEASTKWRVNVGWEYIRGVARSVKFDIEDYIAE